VWSSTSGSCGPEPSLLTICGPRMRGGGIRGRGSRAPCGITRAVRAQHDDVGTRSVGLLRIQARTQVSAATSRNIRPGGLKGLRRPGPRPNGGHRAMATPWTASSRIGIPVGPQRAGPPARGPPVHLIQDPSFPCLATSAISPLREGSRRPRTSVSSAGHPGPVSNPTSDGHATYGKSRRPWANGRGLLRRARRRRPGHGLRGDRDRCRGGAHTRLGRPVIAAEDRG